MIKNKKDLEYCNFNLGRNEITVRGTYYSQNFPIRINLAERDISYAEAKWVLKILKRIFKDK